MNRRVWIDRTFAKGLPPEALIDVVERLRGTPARLEERAAELSDEILRRPFGEKWSILRNIGHLLDLEPLWAGRLDDFERGAPELRPADMSNTETEHADHDAAEARSLLHSFRKARRALVERFETMNEKAATSTSLHPRLGQPMNPVDLAFFVAEHDDHHLARITEIIQKCGT